MYIKNTYRCFILQKTENLLKGFFGINGEGVYYEKELSYFRNHLLFDHPGSFYRGYVFVFKRQELMNITINSTF